MQALEKTENAPLSALVETDPIVLHADFPPGLRHGPTANPDFRPRIWRLELERVGKQVAKQLLHMGRHRIYSRKGFHRDARLALLDFLVQVEHHFSRDPRQVYGLR